MSISPSAYAAPPPNMTDSKQLKSIQLLANDKFHEIAQMATDLEKLADRIFGHEPTQDSRGGNGPTPPVGGSTMVVVSPAIRDLREAVDGISAPAKRIQRAIERLNELA